jgi:hypothetical protein
MHVDTLPYIMRTTRNTKRQNEEPKMYNLFTHRLLLCLYNGPNSGIDEIVIAQFGIDTMTTACAHAQRMANTLLRTMSETQRMYVVLEDIDGEIIAQFSRAQFMTLRNAVMLHVV